MGSRDDPTPLISPSSQPSALSCPPSFAIGLEPLPPLSPSPSDLLHSKDHPLFSDASLFSASSLPSSAPPLNFPGFPAFKGPASSPAEPKMGSFAVPLSGGFGASSSPSPMGLGAPASHGCSPEGRGDLSVPSSSPDLPPAPGSVTIADLPTGGVPRPLEALLASPIPPFLSKTYEIVDAVSLDAVVSWASGGESFVVWDPVEFSRAVLPRHFKHNNFSSFVRQLNTYLRLKSAGGKCLLKLHFALSLGFHKIDTDRWEFANEDFLRGQKHLLRNIHRRRSSQVQQIDNSLSSSVELARSGLGSEVDDLRKNKNSLMQEVARMQKDHLTMIQQMNTIKQRMQLAEDKQKQMVSFLAKVLQNPTFLEHLKQQKEKRELTSTRFKRKFLNQSEANQRELGSSCVRQAVKCNQVDGTPASSMNPGMEINLSKQIEDFFLQEMEDKLGLDMNRQEVFGTPDETGEKIAALLDSSDVIFKGKSVVTSPMVLGTAAAEYLVLSPENISQEKIFSDAVYPENEVIGLSEGTWNMDFVAETSLVDSGNDAWNNMFNEDAQELDFDAGSSTSWNMDSQRGGDLVIDKLVGDQLSLLGHQEQGGRTQEDSLEDMDP